MTANELANELDLRKNRLTGKEHELGARAILLYGHSADMLRQQQAEIEKLKSIVEDTIGQAFYEDDYHKAQAEIEALKEALKNIIVISDRKHDAWDRAKELIKEARKK